MYIYIHATHIQIHIYATFAQIYIHTYKHTCVQTYKRTYMHTHKTSKSKYVLANTCAHKQTAYVKWSNQEVQSLTSAGAPLTLNINIVIINITFSPRRRRPPQHRRPPLPPRQGQQQPPVSKIRSEKNEECKTCTSEAARYEGLGSRVSRQPRMYRNLQRCVSWYSVRNILFEGRPCLCKLGSRVSGSPRPRQF